MLRPIFQPLLLAALIFRLPTPALAQTVAPTSMSPAAPTLAERLDEVERVEVGVELAPDTFTIGATSALRASVPKP